MLHVAILVHRYDAFDELAYWLRAISQIWHESGVRISVIQGPQARIEADLAILHVDLTVVPEDYLAFIRQYPVVINGGVTDISKRMISAHLVRREDCHDEGPIIVKTDRNHKGKAEAHLAKKVWSSGRGSDLVSNYRLLASEAYRAAGRWWRNGSTKSLGRYRVFESARDVPDKIWNDPELIVERFLPERRNGHYCVRTWLFLGDQERNTLFYANEPLIKSGNIIGHEPLPEVPEAIRQMRRELKFDFGKFDYAVVDGQPVLFDANRTPTFGSFPKERYFPIAKILAQGIDAFL